jgi:hypothetical protein
VGGVNKMRVRKGREMETKVKSCFQEQAPSVVYACELHAVPPNFYVKGRVLLDE